MTTRTDAVLLGTVGLNRAAPQLRTRRSQVRILQRVAADQNELAGGNWRFSFVKRQLILFHASNASRFPGVQGRFGCALPV